TCSRWRSGPADRTASHALQGLRLISPTLTERTPNTMDARLSTSPEESLPITLHQEIRTAARIKVIGVGGGGCNAVGRMVSAGLGDVESIVANTDQQALLQNPAPVKLQIGSQLTKGLGACANPNIGRET